MASFRTTFTERMTLRPGLVDLEPQGRQRGFAIVLFDGFTKRNALVGVYEDDERERQDQAEADRTGDAGLLRAYTIVRLANRSLVPLRKPTASTYVFVADLSAGVHVVEVRSPYYQPRDIPIQLPSPALSWPAFPDVTLANEDLPLDSALQPAAYRAQRQAVALTPSTKYPFPAPATLVRGTVRAGSLPLAGATVTRVGRPGAYVTGEAGDYVLFLEDVPGIGASVTIGASHPLHPPVNAPVQALRGMTVLRDIAMA